eukprot:58531-Prymnesium_polylepis.1
MPVRNAADELLARGHLPAVALAVGELGERDRLGQRRLLHVAQPPEAHLLLVRDALAAVLLRLELEPDLAEP